MPRMITATKPMTIMTITKAMPTRHRIIALILLAALGFTGCTAYKPRALEPDRQWARLERISLDDLVVDRDQPSGESAVPAFDYSDGLSPDEAAALAIMLNPDLLAFREERRIAKGQLIAAGLLPNPDIDLQWLVPVAGGLSAVEIETAFDLTAALLLRKPRIEQAKIRLEELNWEALDREWRLANETRRAFTGVTYWDRALDLNRQERAIADRTLAIIRAQQAAGATTELEVLLAESEVAEIQRRARRLTGERRGALQQLNRLLGVPPNHATRLQTSDKPLAYAKLTGELSELAQRIRSRPDLKQAEQAYLGAEKQLHIATLGQWPHVGLGPSYERGEGESSLGAGLSVELPIFDRNQGEIAVSTAERRQKRHEYIALLHEARSELYDAWERLETLDGELSFYFSDIGPRLDRSLKLTEDAFEAGDLDLLQVLLLQSRVLTSKREILEMLRDYHLAKTDLMQALGPQ